MKNVFFVSLVLVASSAFANNCPNEMKAIDAKLATGVAIGAADLEKVKALRADGEKFHKDGNHDASMKALSEAKKLLKM